MKIKYLFITLLSVLILVFQSCDFSGNGSDSVIVTSEDYSRAESMLAQNTSGLVDGVNIRPAWLDNNTFWYSSLREGSRRFVIVDTDARTVKPAFDHKKLAKAFAEVSDIETEEDNLPVSSIEYSENGKLLLRAFGEDYLYDPLSNKIELMGRPATPAYSVMSPDGSKAAYIKDFNLWVRDMESGKDNRLTSDGLEDYGYATNNAGWTLSKSPVLLWSPDSKKIASFRHDGRYVGEMYLATTRVGHPELEQWKYPLPGDSLAFRIERVLIDVESGELTFLDMEADQHRSTTTDHIAGRGGVFLDVEWSANSKKLSFVSTSRDHRHEIFRLADPVSGKVRDVFEEREETFFESGYNARNWRFLEESDEVIWYSQRDNWGHLYLYDLATGEVKNQITSGDWKVLDLKRVDQKNRRLYFTACGKEAGDPYFQYLYSINMDGSDLKLHTPDSANHEVYLSDDGSSFVDYFSTPVTPPLGMVRYLDGSEAFEFERSDISRLVKSGWVAPVPFSVKARDGKTDIYGLMHKPSNFDPDKKYPIINYIYPGPQSGSVGSRSFAASRSDRQSIAELGFIVVAIDAMGTPMRSKSFHEAYYGNMGDNGLPDQIAGMKELARRHSWIDIDRVGIYGHSGGGFASTDAILRYPDFFDVAVSGAGNHDNRNYEDDWGEKWQGLLERNADGTDNYYNQANQLLAGNLKGKLLLAHGTMDSNVPPYNTLLVVNELIAANKDFDLILFPNRGHGFGNEPYMMRRRWDYFVKHLLGALPPENYEIGK